MKHSTPPNQARLTPSPRRWGTKRYTGHRQFLMVDYEYPPAPKWRLCPRLLTNSLPNEAYTVGLPQDSPTSPRDGGAGDGRIVSASCAWSVEAPISCRSWTRATRRIHPAVHTSRARQGRQSQVVSTSVDRRRLSSITPSAAFVEL